MSFSVSEVIAKDRLKLSINIDWPFGFVLVHCVVIYFIKLPYTLCTGYIQI